MSLINYASREINCKLVYYGPGLGGKTTLRMPADGAIGYAVNAKAWNAFDPRVRQLIQSEVAALERSIWGVADEFTQQGYDCNAGTAQCRLGQKGRMTVVQPSAADLALLKKVLGEVTVPKWAERCTAACVNVFNNQVAPLVGVALKK